MTFGELISPITALFRVTFSIFSLFKRNANHPIKRLEARLHMRGIVSEIPHYLPFHICDENGLRHKGIYAIGIFLWNKGNQPITHADLISSAPLQIQIGAGAELVDARVIPAEDQTDCSAIITSPNTLIIDFDCINPKEYLMVCLFVTGKPTVDIQITGRIVGQESPIDHTAEEVKAPMGERFSAFILLALIANMIPGFFIGGWFLVRDYGIAVLWEDPNSVPILLRLSFSMGAMLLFMVLYSRAKNWNERRKIPEGYPLYADLEPSFLKTILGLIKTVFQGKKQRISTSLFEWGKPILMPNKKIKKRTIDDWIQ